MFFFKPRNTSKGYSLWFLYFLSINALVVVHALKECNNVPGDVCKCRTDEGVIDLWKLAGTGSDVPRYGVGTLDNKSDCTHPGFSVINLSIEHMSHIQRLECKILGNLFA